MATCWLVTSGYYSDYRVHAVCLTKEAAELTVARDDEARAGWERGYGYGEDLQIEEVPLLDGTEPMTIYKGWTASGYVTVDEIPEPSLSAHEEDREEYISNEVKLRGNKWERWVYVTGPDRDRVKKAYFDQATIAQAQLRGIA